MINQRMCVACRNMKDRKELLRLVRVNDEIIIDDSGKIDGRGAYICRSNECVKKAMKLKSFNRTFKCNISKEIYDKLEERFDKQ